MGWPPDCSLSSHFGRPPPHLASVLLWVSGEFCKTTLTRYPLWEILPHLPLCSMNLDLPVASRPLGSAHPACLVAFLSFSLWAQVSPLPSMPSLPFSSLHRASPGPGHMLRSSWPFPRQPVTPVFVDLLQEVPCFLSSSGSLGCDLLTTASYVSCSVKTLRFSKGGTSWWSSG